MASTPDFIPPDYLPSVPVDFGGKCKSCEHLRAVLLSAPKPIAWQPGEGYLEKMENLAMEYGEWHDNALREVIAKDVPPND